MTSLGGITAFVRRSIDYTSPANYGGLNGKNSKCTELFFTTVITASASRQALANYEGYCTMQGKVVVNIYTHTYATAVHRAGDKYRSSALEAFERHK
jgi:hypothetical protein